MEQKETRLRELVKRIPGTREFINYDAKRCTGCGRCVKVCPMSIWGFRQNKASLSRDYAKRCLECGSCWIVCEANAIDFRYPDGGTGVIWEYG